MRKKKEKKKFLSVIVPAYKQEKTIRTDLQRIKEALKQARYDYEIICVVDGQVDGTLSQAKKLKSKKLKVTGYEQNYGKGYAVRYGMAKSRGEIIAFIDAGMDIDPHGLSLLLEHFEWYNADIIIGSKRHPVSEVDYPFWRRVLSFGYQFLVRILFGLKVRDTQVGMKFFKRKVLENVLPRLLIKHYAFDIEMLSVAYRLGYKRIFEAPIRLEWRGQESVISKSLWRSLYRMLWDTLTVFYRLRILRWYDEANKRKWGANPELNFKR